MSNGSGKIIAIAGSMLGKIAPSAIQNEVDEWLGEHITNPNSPPLDRSLSSSSSAAPADMVGDLKSALNYVNLYGRITYETNGSASKIIRTKTLKKGMMVAFDAHDFSQSTTMANSIQCAFMKTDFKQISKTQQTTDDSKKKGRAWLYVPDFFAGIIRNGSGTSS